MKNLVKALFQTRESVEEKPKTGEMAWYDNTFFAGAIKFDDFNPDKLVQRKGNKIYDKMLLDPQVKSAYNLIVSTITARRFSFELPNNEDVQEEIREFFLYNLSHIKGTFKSVLRNILSAKANGFSISEKVWDVGKYEGSEKWLIKDIKLKPFETFMINSDRHGNIIDYIQETPTGKIRIPADKIIHYVNQKDINEVWGVSDLMSCYRAFWEKDNIQKFWNIYLEKFAGGMAVAKPTTASANLAPAEKISFQNALKNITASTSVRLPFGYDLDIVSTTSTDAFQKAIEYRDSQIARALLIPNLMGFSPQGNTGSMAQAKVQVDLFLNMINEQADLLADALNEQLFCQLAMYNYPVEDYPKITFEPLTTEEKREVVLAWNEALKSGSVENTEEDQIKTRELLGYPTNIELNEQPKQPEQPEQTEKPEEKTIEKKEFSQKPDAEELEALLDKNEEKMQLSMFRITRRIEKQLYKDVGKTVSKIKETSNIREVERLSIANALKSELNKSIKESLRSAYEDGRKTAQDELRKAAEKLPEEERKKVKFTIATAKRNAVKFNSEREFTAGDFVDGLTLQEINRILPEKAFYITGVLNDDILAAARQAIINGIENNLSIKDIRVNLAEALEPIFGKVTFDPETGEVIKVEQQPGAPITEKQVPARLETIARTNITGIFNQGRLAIGSDPDLGDFVEGYEYSAIIDRRTTQFCRVYDGFTRPKDDPIWKSITPPNHFNALSEGTLITTKKGLIPIENIRPGDLVKTHTGRFKKVYDVMAKKPDTKFYKKLNLSTGRSLFITDEHPVLTLRGWNHTADLKVGDILFNDSKKSVGVLNDVLLPDPDYFPFTLNEVSTPYDISFASIGRRMTFPVKLNNDSKLREGKVAYDMINTELKFIGRTTDIKPIDKSFFVFSRVVSEMISKGIISFRKYFNVVNRIVNSHSFRVPFVNIRRFFRKAIGPMVDSFRFIKFITDSNLLLTGSNGNAMSFAPITESAIRPAETPFNATDGLLTVPMPVFDKFFNGGFVGKVHNTSENKINTGWKSVQIISIEEVECKSNLWNLAVEEDETYIAEGVIVHNCRSVLIFATVMDDWKPSKLPKEKSKETGKKEIVQPGNGFGTVKEKNEVK